MELWIKTSYGTFIPGMGLVSIPTYISRNKASKAWVINKKAVPEALQHYFSDYQYQNSTASLKAAIKELRITMGGVMYKKRKLPEHERASKIRPLGVVGVFHESYLTNTGLEVHRFCISDPVEQRTIHVYIGTENTYLGYWDGRLADAIMIRTRIENEYKRQNRWKSLYDVEAPPQ